jgi:hypothetical protein
MPNSGAELVAYWQKHGMLGAYANEPDSPEFARQLRKLAETREW